MSYSGTAYENVTVDVFVDTDPFDNSVDNCNNKVDLLTGAVAATEAAEIAAIELNSKKVANTIISGFFKLIRSDISQQIMELSKQIDAKLIYLRELGKRCNDKQRQMDVDYNRLASNYSKIFTDLNKELDLRIRELDKHAFTFRRLCAEQTDRMSQDDIISTVSIGGAEEMSLQAQIIGSSVKKKALETIGVSNRFLAKQKQTNDTIDHSMIDSDTAGCRYLPVCFMESVRGKQQVDRNVYQPSMPVKMDDNELIDQMRNCQWNETDKEKDEAIGRYFNQEVIAHYNTSDPHDVRVREMILNLFNNQIK